MAWVAIWLVAGIWFAWFGYVRWTTEPPGQMVSTLAPRGRALPRELERLLKAIPTPRVASMPASMPAGGWISPHDTSWIVTGEWNTTRRPELAFIASHVSSAAVQAPLDELTAWLYRHTPVELERLERPESDPNNPFLFTFPNPPANAERALLFRARQAATEREDYSGAWDNLRALIRLHAALRASLAAYLVTESPIEFELGCLAQEVALPPALAREMIATLRAELGLSVADAAHQPPESQGHFASNPDELLNAFYTDDGNGDGWLVLTAMTRSMPTQTGRPLAPRSGAWNLLSPLYYGRAQMRNRLAARLEQVQAWDETGYATAAARMKRFRSSADAPNVFDGAMMFATPWTESSLKSAYDATAQRRAVVVMLALSAHKASGGAYPEKLDELVPALLDAVPMDPLSGQPFSYSRAGEGYRLLRPVVEGDPNAPQTYYGGVCGDMRYPLHEGTYQPMRERKP